MQDAACLVDTRTLRVHAFSGFPKEIARIIAGYSAEYTLLDWIPADKLDPDTFYMNQHLFDDNPMISQSTIAAMTEDRRARIGMDRHLRMVENPMSANLIKANPDIYICIAMWKNPAILDWLLERGTRIDWDYLAQNPCEKAVKMVLSHSNRGYYYALSQNPAAIGWLRANTKLISKYAICANPAAIDIIQGLGEINYHWLCSNPHPWAIEHLRLNQEKIVWYAFSSNPGIFEARTDPALVARLVEM